MLATLTLLLLVLALAGACNAVLQFSDCCKGTACSFSPQSVQLNPEPPVIGSALTAHVNGNWKTGLAGGSGQFNVLYNLNGMYQPLPPFQSPDICTLLPSVGAKCPIQPGPFAATFQLTVPAITPPGQYAGNLTINDASKQLVACVQWAVQMS